jgi:probable HAF family extracellular repeat protein
MTDLGTLGGPSSTALAINKSGWIVGTSVTATGSMSAFVWQSGRMTRLPALGRATGSASAINAHGRIAGMSRTSAGDTHAALWVTRS